MELEKKLHEVIREALYVYEKEALLNMITKFIEEEEKINDSFESSYERIDDPAYDKLCKKVSSQKRNKVFELYKK